MATNKYTLASRVTLANGKAIPQIQLGLYMMSGKEATKTIPWALGAGYRGFDCAQMYHNEREAGKAIRDYLSSSENTQGLKREDIFYTTKLASNGTSYDSVRRSIKESVNVSGLGYVDLFLLRSPYGGKEARLTSWKAVEDAITDGEVKMGGVSNYGSAHIEELMASRPRVAPVINQIEVHPFNTQVGIRETCAEHNIAIEAYAPLARGMRMKHPKILALAKKHGCSPAQLFVRWSLQHEMITLPKSVRKDRLVENASVADFEISKEDLVAMDDLDENLVTDCIPHGIHLLESIAEGKGWTVGATEDSSVFTNGSLSEYTTLVFLSTTGNFLNSSESAALEEFLLNGGTWLGIHAAGDFGDELPAWYNKLVGGQFRSHPCVNDTVCSDEQLSRYPPGGNIRPDIVTIQDADHPSTAGLPTSQNRTDEWYAYKSNVAHDVHYTVLATLEETYIDEITPAEPEHMDPHPISWYSLYEGISRAFYTGMGHTNESYAEEYFIRHITGGLEWVTGA
ncbi:putative oxidoreductase [Colletotrichum spinosum]|uniref:Putative oxidoreductase n=1 Tax=Colletotrichum spinosum TaxID=1347390 RepID=A0A4R8Q884_9PEZI|nr:putative oxidoreductase [Colletotrichum spinosum]